MLEQKDAFRIISFAQIWWKITTHPKRIVWNIKDDKTWEVKTYDQVTFSISNWTDSKPVKFKTPDFCEFFECETDVFINPEEKFWNMHYWDISKDMIWDYAFVKWNFNKEKWEIKYNKDLA